MSDDIEFYAPWRLTKPYKPGSQWVIWDDNMNPMAYSDDPTFLEEAVKRINAYEELLIACEQTAAWIAIAPEFQDWPAAQSRLQQLRAAIAKARGTEADDGKA